MNICSECNKFIVCCDFCMYAKYDEGFYCGPTGCSLHPNEEHQKIAQHCSSCENYTETEEE